MSRAGPSPCGTDLLHFACRSKDLDDLFSLIGPALGETVIEDNIIEHNYSENLGGGIEIINARSIIIRRNKIIRNHAPGDGGGISAGIGSGRVVIEDNLLLENIAGDKGGALYLYTSNPSEFVVERNLIVRNEAKLSIHNDRGAGGGLYAENARGSLRHNTFVGNISRDSRVCGGGGIGLNVDIGTFIVQYNIIANSQGCGIACIYNGGERVGPNLLWDNQGGDLGSGDRACPEEWGSFMLITDPFFCDPDADDYSVAENSPALEAEVMGAFAEPGCAPVAVLPITWGRLKALHSSGP